jgi:phytoene synthase
MQLTNIARDVGEDARNGRLYLPLDWLAEEGIDARAFLEKPTFKPGLARVVSRLLDEADGLYRRAEAGIAGLPPDCRAAIRAASLIYSEIGRVVRGHGCDSVNQRAVTSTARKLALLASAFRPGRAEPWASAAPALPANLFLVRATQGPDSFAPPSTVRLWTFPEAFNIAARARAALAIVERLEHAERRGLQPSLD